LPLIQSLVGNVSNPLKLWTAGCCVHFWTVKSLSLFIDFRSVVLHRFGARQAGNRKRRTFGITDEVISQEGENLCVSRPRSLRSSRATPVRFVAWRPLLRRSSRTLCMPSSRFTASSANDAVPSNLWSCFVRPASARGIRAFSGNARPRQRVRPKAGPMINSGGGGIRFSVRKRNNARMLERLPSPANVKPLASVRALSSCTTPIYLISAQRPALACFVHGERIGSAQIASVRSLTAG
jgi:hypothetical protein